MKKSLCLLIAFAMGFGGFAQMQESKNDLNKPVPIEKIKEVGLNWATMLWGPVYPDEPIPLYSLDEEVIAYTINFAIGTAFPGEDVQFGMCRAAENEEHNGRWLKDRYGNVMVSANFSTIPIIRYQKMISDEYAWRDKIEEMARARLGDPIRLSRIYYMTDLVKWYCYSNGSQKVYVKVFPPMECLTEEEFRNLPSKPDYSKKGMWSIPADTRGKWNKFTTGGVLKNLNTDYLIADEDYTPYNDWSYGCTPTAFAMALAYHDHRSAISANNYGNLVKHHFYRYDPVQGDQDMNVSDLQRDLASEMSTSAGGGTGPCCWLSGFLTETNQRGYSFSGQDKYGTEAQYLSWAQTETGANRPWHHGTPGHSNTGVGYTSNDFIIRHNTWNPGLDYVDVATCDLVGTIVPGGAYGASIELTAPNGDPGYNHTGDGEIVYSGNVFEITWDYDAYANSYCKMYYSTDAGLNWTLFESNTPNDGSYLWTVPAGLNSTQGRLRIEEYSSTGTLIASDGGWGDFSFMTGGAIVTLNSDVSHSTTTDPTYYQINHPDYYWGAVGIRANSSSDNWSMKMFSTNTFTTQVAQSYYTTEVDFIVFDQNHLTNGYKGLETYRYSGSGNATTEFEGSTEMISVGTPVTHAWPAGDVVEIWDVYLTPGTYKFTMNYNSGSANLDMALFSSSGGTYYKNREGYMARSAQTGTTNEVFYTSISTSDYYGFIVWANDGNAANVTISAVTTTAGLWEGDVSTNWNTPGNWNDNNVPTSLTDVVIPGGTPYSPYINSAVANAKTLTVQSGATLTVGAYNLNVTQDIHIYGTLAMNNTTDLVCGGSMYWEGGSTANITNASAEMYITGNWNFEAGANVQLNAGYVEFEGTSTSFIRSYNSSCWFNHVRSDKSGSFVGVSNWSTADLLVKGTIYIYSGSAFNSYSEYKVIVSGSMNNMGGHFLCNFGTFEFNGNPVTNLKPNSGDYFNNLIINVTTELNLDNTYNDTLFIYGNLDINSGSLKSNSHVISINGNWANNVGSIGFYESLGTVVFSKTTGYQLCYGDNFYNVEKSSTSGYLNFEGVTNIYNNFNNYGDAYAYENMYIDNLFIIGAGASFHAYFDISVDIDDLDMGSPGNYGLLNAAAAEVYVGNLADNGLFGSFYVQGPNAILDITQDAVEYVDLNGYISMNNGLFSIHGGNGPSYWSYGDDASISMSGGTLHFDNSITIYNSPAYTFTQNISGGTIRTNGSLTFSRAIGFTGGTFEFSGSTPAIATMVAGANLNHMLVNKPGTNLSLTSSTFYVGGDLTIQSGTLIPSTTLYVGGDWLNTVGTTGFSEGTKTVEFYGSNQSQILTDETFYHVNVNKTYGFAGLELMDYYYMYVNGNFTASTGSFEMDPYTLCDIAGNLSIASGAGFNANDTWTMVYLAGNFNDANASISTTTGFDAGYSGLFTFDGSSTQTFQATCDPEPLNRVTLNKSGGTVDFYDNVLVRGDLNITSGAWNDGVTGLVHAFQEDFTIASGGYWYDGNGTVKFTGSAIQQFENLGSYAIFKHVTVESSSAAGGLNLNSNLISLNGGDLAINYGSLWTNGNLVRVVGNIAIQNGGTFVLDNDSELNIGNSGLFNVYSGGRLQTIGTENHDVIIKSNDSNFWQFNCYSGGTIAAEWTRFSGMDNWGLYIFSGGLVDLNYSFNHCRFSQSQSSGTLLWINNAQTLNIEYANFPTQGVSSRNVGKSLNNGVVNMVNATGSFAGEDFDLDPYSLVNWTENISVMASLTHVSCYGQANGAIDITVSGGTPGYTYLWSDGSTNGDRIGLAANNYTLTTTDHYGAQDVSTFLISQPALYTVNAASLTHVSCFGGNDGAIWLVLNGGTFPDQFLWSNGNTTGQVWNLSAGTYSVTCTDAQGCVATNSFVVTQPSPLILTGIPSNALCHGSATGSVTTSVSGGTPPYTYHWSDGGTASSRYNLLAGTYGLTVTDSHGCTASSSWVISQPASGMVMSFSLVHVNCYGGATGSIDLSMSGGTPPYGYAWTTGATTQDIFNLSAGAYTVTVTDANGCTVGGTRTITQPAMALNLLYATTNVTCFGGTNGSIDLTPSGGTSPYTYLWNGGFTTQDRLNIPAGVYSVTVTDANGCVSTGSRTITQPATAPSMSFVTVNVLCNGSSTGSIDMTPSGGTPPYTYLWNGGFTSQDRLNIPAGVYTVTLTDLNGCSATGNRTITQPAAIIISGTVTNVSTIGGSNGSISTTVTGGNAPYSYLWSNGQTGSGIAGLLAGTYSLTVTDGVGCTKTASFTVLDGTVSTLAVSGIASPVACFGLSTGSIDITITGGTPPYGYLWSDGVTLGDRFGLSAGVYSLTVTDGVSSSVTATWTVSQPASALTLTFTQVNVACFGSSTGSIDLTPSGGTAPYTYLWTGGATTQDRSNLAAGVYGVTVTDANGCSATGSRTITQPASAISLAFTQVNVACFGSSTGSIDLTPAGGTAPYTYLWTGGATTQDRSNLAAGVYGVTVTDANGCSATGSRTITQPASAISLTFTQVNVACFDSSTGSIDLTPAGGTAPYTYIWTGGATTQDRSNLAAGVYGVTVTDANGCSATGSRTITQPASALGLAFSKINVSCFGTSDGYIDLTPWGGTAPYSYAWTDGATTQDRNNLAAGTYSVTVTDANGCTTGVPPISITQPAALVLAFTQVNVACFGSSTGSIDLTPSGGMAPYSYAWNLNGIPFGNTQDLANLNSGLYSVTVTDNNWCFTTGSRTITQPASPLTLSTTTTATAIDLTVTGGALPYGYLWSNSATTEDISGLSAGSYTVTVTDSNGCTGSASATVAGLTLSQTIAIPANWSIISTYMIPTNPNIAAVFSPVVSNLVIAKNGSGQMYWPQFNLNSIGNMVLGQGYQVKMTNAVSLVVTGTPCVPETTPVSIPSGWSLLGYLRTSNGAVTTMLATISGNIVIMKSGTGLMYWPQFNINQIVNLIPGLGYQLKLTAASTLTYPANSFALGKATSPVRKPVFFACENSSESNMTLGIRLPGPTLPEGSEIGVFTGQGILAGSAIAESGFVALTLWGDDDLTTQTDGLVDGESYVVRLFNGASGLVSELDGLVYESGEAGFERNKIAVATLPEGQISMLEGLLLRSYPNPFTERTTVSVYLEESGPLDLRLVSPTGQLIRSLYQGSASQGLHRFDLDREGMAAGLYFLKATSVQSTETISIQILK